MTLTLRLLSRTNAPAKHPLRVVDLLLLSRIMTINNPHLVALPVLHHRSDLLGTLTTPSPLSTINHRSARKRSALISAASVLW